MKKKGRWIPVIGCLMLVLFLAAFGKTIDIKSTAEQEFPSQNQIVVGVSQLGIESMWRTANSASIQQALCKENGYFLLFNNARQKQENQIKAIRSYISQRVDYIVFSPIVEDGWETVLQEAKEADIPVIVMDRNVSCDPSLYTAWVGSDFTEEGRNAARWLEEDLKGKKFDQKETVHIVVLRGTSNASATLGRTKGFAEIAKTHPNWEILDSDDADFTTAKGREVMEKYLQKYKDIDVVVSQNDDMTFGAIEAIRAAGKTTGTGGDITLISFDGTRSALEKVKSGVINVDIECNPLQGTYIQEIINRLEDGEPVDKINYVEEKVYTQKNVLSVLGDRVY